MNITFSKKELVDALKGAKIVLRKNTSSMVHIVAKKDNISIIADEGIESYCCDVDATVKKEGVVKLYLNQILKQIKRLPEGLLEISCKNGTDIEMYSTKENSNKITIIGRDVNEYLNLPKIEDKEPFLIFECSDLGNIINKIEPFAENSESRYALSHIVLECKDKKLSMAGSCGRALAVFKIDFQSSEDFYYLLDSSFLRGLSKGLLKAKKGKVRVFKTLDNICFQYERTLLSTTSSSKEYPNYIDFIPSKKKRSFFTVDNEALLNSIKLCDSCFDNKELNKIELSLDGEDLTIRAIKEEEIRLEQKVKIEYSGNPFTIGFNSSMFLKGISNLSGVIKFYVDTNEDPILFKMRDCNDFHFVIMPRRLQA